MGLSFAATQKKVGQGEEPPAEKREVHPQSLANKRHGQAGPDDHRRTAPALLDEIGQAQECEGYPGDDQGVAVEIAKHDLGRARKREDHEQSPTHEESRPGEQPAGLHRGECGEEQKETREHVGDAIAPPAQQAGDSAQDNLVRGVVGRHGTGGSVEVRHAVERENFMGHDPPVGEHVPARGCGVQRTEEDGQREGRGRRFKPGQRATVTN